MKQSWRVMVPGGMLIIVVAVCLLFGVNTVLGATANNDAATTNEDTAVTIGVLGNDAGSALRVGSVGAPVHGTVTIVDASTGTIRYTPSANWNGTDSFTYTITEGSTLLNPDNGHYYEFVSAQGQTWFQARDGAASRMLFGLHGYLVTITSAGEQSFVQTKLIGYGWMGASDAEAEGTWRWVTGPENAQGLTYTNWHGGEPNNYGGNEDYAHFYADGSWNDFNENNDATAGYVVEYGGMTSDVPTAPPTATVTVTVNRVNDPPIITEGDSTPVTMDEDSYPSAFALTLHAGDVDGDTLSWNISNAGAHGVPSVGMAGSVQYVPTTNWNGTDSFAVQVGDGQGGTAAITVNVTVRPRNDPPINTVSPAVSGTPHPGKMLTVTPGSWQDAIDNPVTAFTFGYRWQRSADGGTTWSNISNATEQQYSVASADLGRLLSCAVTCYDSDMNSGLPTPQVAGANSQSVTVVNAAPLIAQGSLVSVTMSEDGFPSVWSLSLSASDPDGDALVWSITSPATHGTATASGTGSSKGIGYVPNADYSGADSFIVQVSDGNGGTNSIVVDVGITAVNDPPSFVTGSDQMVLEDCGAQTVAWATSISAGPANESTQSLTFTVTGNTNPGLFTTGPLISSTGVLSYTPVANANGTATITVTLTDDATAGGAALTTVSQTFKISFTAVNDAPCFAKGADLTVLEDCGVQSVASWATLLSAGPSDESGQVLDFVVSNNSTALFSVQPAISAGGTLTFTPAPSMNGTATVTVTLHDNGGTANGGTDSSSSQTFTIAINPVNDVPANTVVPSIGGTMHVGDTLTVDPGSWNDIIDTGVSGSSRLTFTYQWMRADDAFGAHAVNIASATSSTYVLTNADAHKILGVLVTCTDNGVGLPDTQSVSLMTRWTSQVVNCVPVVAEGVSTLVTMDEDGSPSPFRLTLHAADADGDPLTWNIVTAASHGAAAASGTGFTMPVAYTPVADWNGTDTFVVRVDDGYGATTDVSVTVQVDPRNDASVNTLLPQVSGIAHVGQVLTTATGAWNDTIDLVPGTLSWTFQWQRSTDGGVTFVDIPGATSATYLLTIADNLQLVRSKVTCTDSGEGLPLRQSTSAVSPPVAVLNVSPVISEGPVTSVACDEDENPAPFGLTLHAVDADGIDTLAWHITSAPAHGTLSFAANPSGLAISPVYHPAPDWNGTDSFVLRVDDGLGSFDEISTTVIVNPRNDAPVNTLLPGIDGDVFVNHEVHAIAGNWNDHADTDVSGTSVLSYSYQWLRASDATGTGLAPIPGATASSCVVSPVDEGTYLAVRVTCSDDGAGSPAAMTARADSAFVLARYLDVTPPTIELSELSSRPGVLGYSSGDTPSFTVTDASFSLPFTVDDDRLSGVHVSVSVGGRIVITCGDGSSSDALQLAEGPNSVVINAVDAAGHVSSRHLSITLDTHAPVVTFSAALPTTTSNSSLSLAGSIRDNYSGVRSLSIDGIAVIPYADGTFRYELSLKKGENTILVTAVDGIGNSGSQTCHVIYAPSAPHASSHMIVLVIGSRTMTVDGVETNLDAPAAIVEDRTLVPLRALVENLGGSISWNARTRQVTVKARGTTIVLTIGRNTATVNGKALAIDPKNSKVVPFVTSGRTMLPLRFVAENLGLRVNWNAKTRAVTLTWDN